MSIYDTAAKYAYGLSKGKPLLSCNCIGPQSGQPRCPCAMRGVIVRDGRYIVPEQDLGPVRTEPKEPTNACGQTSRWPLPPTGEQR